MKLPTATELAAFIAATGSKKPESQPAFIDALNLWALWQRQIVAAGKIFYEQEQDRAKGSARIKFADALKQLGTQRIKTVKSWWYDSSPVYGPNDPEEVWAERQAFGFPAAEIEQMKEEGGQESQCRRYCTGTVEKNPITVCRARR